MYLFLLLFLYPPSLPLFYLNHSSILPVPSPHPPYSEKIHPTPPQRDSSTGKPRLQTYFSSWVGTLLYSLETSVSVVVHDFGPYIQVTLSFLPSGLYTTPVPS